MCIINMSLKQVFQQQRPRDKFGCKILQPHKKKKTQYLTLSA